MTFSNYVEIRLKEGLDRYPFSAAMKEGITHYVMHGVPMGHFLTAIFSNDLMEAVSRADNKNLELLREYCQFLYNDVPSHCKGSPERVAKWIESHKVTFVPKIDPANTTFPKEKS